MALRVVKPVRIGSDLLQPAGGNTVVAAVGSEHGEPVDRQWITALDSRYRFVLRHVPESGASCTGRKKRTDLPRYKRSVRD